MNTVSREIRFFQYFSMIHYLVISIQFSKRIFYQFTTYILRMIRAKYKIILKFLESIIRVKENAKIAMHIISTIEKFSYIRYTSKIEVPSYRKGSRKLWNDVKKTRTRVGKNKGFFLESFHLPSFLCL